MAFGLSIAYLLLLVFLVFQSFNDIKAWLRWIDPKGLSRWKLDEKVGTDGNLYIHLLCRITPPTARTYPCIACGI
jgi:hypothetical protein